MIYLKITDKNNKTTIKNICNNKTLLNICNDLLTLDNLKDLNNIEHGLYKRFIYLYCDIEYSKNTYLNYNDFLDIVKIIYFYIESNNKTDLLYLIKSILNKLRSIEYNLFNLMLSADYEINNNKYCIIVIIHMLKYYCY